jgi:hypothetical protein
MNLDILLYTPFLEEQDTSIKSWEKTTIEYLCKNKSKVISLIRNIVRKFGTDLFQNADIEDIYSEALLYFYNSDDYNLSKAIERSSRGGMITLEAYINCCVGYCVKRNLDRRRKADKHIAADTYRSESGELLSLLDLIPDKQSEEELEGVLVDLNQQCKMYEHHRYKYGIDIYQMWYVRLLTIVEGLEEDYGHIMNILGITKSDISTMKEKSFKDEMMLGFAVAIDRTGINESIKILENYVYAAHHIKKAIKSLALDS